METLASSVDPTLFKYNGYLSRCRDKLLEMTKNRKTRREINALYTELQVEMAIRHLLRRKVKIVTEQIPREYLCTDIGEGALENGVCFVVVGVTKSAGQEERILIRPDTKLHYAEDGQ